MSIDHDVKSLTVLIEQMHGENRAGLNEMKADITEIKAQTTATNGRLGKAEISIAVLKFAVYTIGGAILAALLATALQVLVGRLTSG